MPTAGTTKNAARWTVHQNEHVRRLVSEGTRPRLPWATRLPAFMENPALIIPLLEALKDDPSEYVRRSVANNLNDIAKDHPDLVSEIAEKWLCDASLNLKKLLRHACRSLIKQGHRATLPAGAMYHASKKHPFKQITTCVYYPGLHRLEILVNGEVQGEAKFELLMP